MTALAFEMARCGLRALTGRFPPRYDESWRGEFEARTRALLRPGIRILDVGSGARPALSPEERPVGCRYVGLDISLDELRRAPPGSYDELRAGDVAVRVPDLQGGFDLALSWQVLEHVRPLRDALENVRSYLTPGGHFIAQMSGSFSVFGLANQMIPRRVGLWAMRHLTARPPESIFTAYYDHCWYGGLERLLATWSEREIAPRFLAGDYLRRLRPLAAAYLVYEEWAYLGRHRNLAAYYLIETVR